MVMHYKGYGPKVNPNDIKIEIPQIAPPPPLNLN
jgi:hypothetical protein